ncbi:MAG TPA: MoaD/ThiS family protein [Vicinamibacteria bacterium]|jgi:molybdopterin synthase sulfur carrier subunit|nr:MoaD/ThiS family protein [Vicinamibacteria bacterium]
MPITVHVPGYLCDVTGGRSMVALEATPATVGEALLALAALHPGVRDRVMNEQGQVQSQVNVFVGRQSIIHTGGLRTPLGDGAELYILPALSAG